MSKKGKKGRRVVTVTTPDELEASRAAEAAAAPAPRGDQVDVVLGGQTVRLTMPRSYAIRADIVGFSGRNPGRATLAALAVCLPHLRRPEVSYEQCRYDVGLFGGAALDWFIEQGYSLDELVPAASAAFDMLQAGLVTASELKEAEGN